MKKFYTLSTLVLCGAMLFTACDGQEGSLVQDRLDDNPLPGSDTFNSGAADFTNYISIGASLTAGYMDGALYDLGQANSIPALIASSLGQAAGDGFAFNQPLINSEKGFNTTLGANPNNLGRYKLDTNIPGPSPTIGGDPISAYGGDITALNNFGVNGVTVGDLLVPSSPNPNLSAFYYRFASDPGNSTILGDAIAQQPTFFSLWIGNNDVLGYAVGGASNPAILTSTGDFNTRFNAVIGQLMANTTADGIVADIPFFLGLAYFQAVPYNPLPLDQPTADQLNQAYANYNGGLQQAQMGGFITQAEADRRTIQFAAGANAFVMEDETLTDLSGLGLPNLRQAEPTDLAVLGLGAILGQDLGNGPYGLQDPATDQYVLIPSEQVEIETARQTFNSIIAGAVAGNSRLAYYNTNDANSVFGDIFGLTDGVPGIQVEGVSLNPDFSPNGVLSTDGVHPNPRGNAILANEFLRVIEETFGAVLPRVEVLSLPSVQVCAGDCVSQQGS